MISQKQRLLQFIARRIAINIVHCTLQLLFNSKTQQTVSISLRISIFNLACVRCSQGKYCFRCPRQRGVRSREIRCYENWSVQSYLSVRGRNSLLRGSVGGKDHCSSRDGRSGGKQFKSSFSHACPVLPILPFSRKLLNNTQDSDQLELSLCTFRSIAIYIHRLELLQYFLRLQNRSVRHSLNSCIHSFTTSMSAKILASSVLRVRRQRG